MSHSQPQLTEAAIVRLWERSSGRRMTSDELCRVRGHALVTYLRRFSQEDLTAAASAVSPHGADLDWRAWRTAVERLVYRDEWGTGAAQGQKRFCGLALASLGAERPTAPARGRRRCRSLAERTCTRCAMVFERPALRQGTREVGPEAFAEVGTRVEEDRAARCGSTR
jgi:hypothetical protein